MSNSYEMALQEQHYSSDEGIILSCSLLPTPTQLDSLQKPKPTRIKTCLSATKQPTSGIRAAKSSLNKHKTKCLTNGSLPKKSGITHGYGNDYIVSVYNSDNAYIVDSIPVGSYHNPALNFTDELTRNDQCFSPTNSFGSNDCKMLLDFDTSLEISTSSSHSIDLTHVTRLNESEAESHPVSSSTPLVHKRFYERVPSIAPPAKRKCMNLTYTENNPQHSDYELALCNKAYKHVDIDDVLTIDNKIKETALGYSVENGYYAVPAKPNKGNNKKTISKRFKTVRKYLSGLSHNSDVQTLAIV